MIPQLLKGLCVALCAATQVTAADLTPKEELGRRLFFDVNLSKNRSQSCATCHAPDAGFVDPRPVQGMRAASLGDDGKAIGDRNAPTASYAHLVPPFAKGADGKWRGGLFHDGRAATLEDQAGGPPLNPAEMGMRSKAEVAGRIMADPAYRQAFPTVFGADALADADTTFRHMTEAIAAFERTAAFSPFDSRYDRYLKGEEQFTEQEELGRTLFFSTQFTNCNQCHQLKTQAGAEGEMFTDYSFHNIGVPDNRRLRRINGHKAKDLGLGGVLKDKAEDGKFKTPSLRNVAVTAPYMHNGAFDDLRTVILFYNTYVSKAPSRQINPETGKPWAKPEIGRNLALKELTDAPALDDRRIDALVAFLKTLTDRRYEPLIGMEQK